MIRQNRYLLTYIIEIKELCLSVLIKWVFMGLTVAALIFSFNVEITLVARDVSTPRKYPSRLSLVSKYSNFDIHLELTPSKVVRLD